MLKRRKGNKPGIADFSFIFSSFFLIADLLICKLGTEGKRCELTFETNEQSEFINNK